MIGNYIFHYRKSLNKRRGFLKHEKNKRRGLNKLRGFLMHDYNKRRGAYSGIYGSSTYS